MQPARVAIVDDDPLFVEYLSVFLRTRGYEASVFTSGGEFLNALAGRSVPDLVLLDVLMPAMDGLETLRAIRGVSPTLPVIMLSGQQVPATIVDAVRQGAGRGGEAKAVRSRRAGQWRPWRPRRPQPT